MWSPTFRVIIVHWETMSRSLHGVGLDKSAYSHLAFKKQF